MNNLSLVLYFADVVSILKLLVIFPAMAIFTVSTIIYFVNGDGVDRSAEKYKKMSGRLMLICIPFIIIGVLIPKERTLYMIAASETGEEIIKNPEAQEILGDVTQIIKKKLKEQLQDLEPKK